MNPCIDVVVIGAGVNGLTCAAFLARAGLKTLVLERQSVVGGCAQSREIAPGFHAPLLAHAAGPLRADVVDGLRLGSHGLTFVSSDVEVTSIAEDGPPLVLYGDPARTANGLRTFSTRDAEAWPRFTETREALGRVISTLFHATPPSIDELAGRDVWSLLRTFRAFRALPKADAYRLLRWAPMAVADLVGETFETERLRAAVAADGIFGTRFGPWSAGSGMVLLLGAANAAAGHSRSWFARGGPGAIATALERALRAAGGDVRTDSDVTRVIVERDRAQGVLLADGTDVRARAVVSAVDPQRTFLRLCDPIDLAPEFLWRMRHYRSHGTVAKVNLALAALPSFNALSRETLAGRVRIAPDIDYLERAFDHSKYGRFSPAPFVELTIPTVLDPALAPDGAHVLSAYVQFAPYALRDAEWDRERDALAHAALSVIERYAPNLRPLIVGQQVLTPLDLERTYGLTGGHIFHGELALDQMLTMRPLLGWGQYRSPIRGLFLCGSGTHPGTGLTGGSGANGAREIGRAIGD
jgi:phytoene dehydrogenase-like protein